MWISSTEKDCGLPDHEKLRAISQYWGVLHRASGLLSLSEYWLPSCEMKQLVSTKLCAKCYVSVAPNLILFLFTVHSEYKCQSMRMKLPWNNDSYYPPEQAMHSSQKRLLLSQKRANHMKKWMPFLPDNLVIRIYNYGGNNQLPKQPAGSQCYQ